MKARRKARQPNAPQPGADRAAGKGWGQDVRDGNGEDAHQSYVKWATSKGIPADVDPWSMQFRAMLAIAHAKHQRGDDQPRVKKLLEQIELANEANDQPRVKKLRKQIEHARERVGLKPRLVKLHRLLTATREAAQELEKELCWPLGFRWMPAVDESKVRDAPPSSEPSSTEIVDFLGRAIASVDTARKKLSKPGHRHSALGLLRSGLKSSGLTDRTALEYLQAMGMEREFSAGDLTSEREALARQRVIGRKKRKKYA